MAAFSGTWLQLTTYICVYYLTFLSHVTCLDCYKCALSDSVEYCSTNSDVQTCPFGYDTCFTQILYEGGSEYEPIQMTKGCITGASCEDEKIRHSNEECSKSDGDFICTTCCTGQNCNKSATSNVTMVTSDVTVIALAAVALVALTTPYIGMISKCWFRIR
ncbi:uncharacterized protein LOC102809995 [Saccoglossus kowalevskii]|uniref:Uncharacterized protein LOC102809995 n=1 Tax=Saccoglossus kowalevskii TaxID=10224 RepID=A0ABM0MSS4_SACKO|nr:PREDICTED: uncharacterized protein LOC102809995 [Saccoglossus kowalevskii]